MLNYSLPTETPTKYSINVLSILQDIQMKVPELLKVMLRSDIILTLSGVRAHTTYIEFTGYSKENIQKLITILANYDISIFPYESEIIILAKDDNWFIINHSALNELPNRYKCNVFPSVKTPIINFDAFSVWSSEVEYQLLNLIVKNETNINSVLAHDLFSPHNLRFGMLLGYPGEAIMSGCSLIDGDKSIDAVIAYHDQYDSAWPIYSYGEDVKDNANVLAHQQLWSDILTLIYESDWHRILKK